MRPVVFLPSLGRPATDFDELATTIGATGRTAVPLDLPGVGSAADRPVGSDLHAVAADVSDRIGIVGPVHLVGHAYGNRVARCLAANWPEDVASLTLLGCGGKIAGDFEALTALLLCFEEPDGTTAHREAVTTAFFAQGNLVPPFWETGWWAEAAVAQMTAVAATAVTDWWIPPEPIPVLALVGAEDRISPPTNAADLVDSVGARGRLVVIDGAGHALLPEQPKAVADAVLSFLDGVDP